MRCVVLIIAFMAFDEVGDISLILQIVILFLLVLGLPFSRGTSGKRNLMLHGYSTVAAVILHTILIFIVMIPSLTGGADELGGLSALASLTVWSHVVLGTAAWVLGLFLVVFWLVYGPSRMMCGRWRRWMSPIFVAWAVSIINGAIIHVVGIL